MKKSILIIGIVLIVAGVAALALRGVSYTKREQVLKIGPIEATAETQKTVPIPPAAGIAAIIGGAALVYLGTRKA
jgi:hypothetical protein